MNVFKFLSIHAGDSTILLIGKPVKRFMVNTAMTLMEDLMEDPAELFDMKPGVVYEFPNDYGYPVQFTIKNKSGSSITPKIYVLEFGDVRRANQPLPPPPPPPPVVELDYIVADKLVKEYEVGDVVSYDDVTVIAHYTDGSTADVSAEATIGTISTETAGDKSLSVCYSEDEITDCTSIAIEVVEPTPTRELVYSEDFIEADISAETDIGAGTWANIKDRYYTYEFEYEITNNVGSNNSLRATNAMTNFMMFSDNVSRTSGTKTFAATGSKRSGKPFQCKIGTSGNSYHVKIWNLKIYLEAEDYVPLMLFAPDEP